MNLSGKTPMEMAMGRKPRGPSFRESRTAKLSRASSVGKFNKLDMKTHLEVQQREDIRRDLAERMKFVPPDLRARETVFTGKKIQAKSSKDEILENG